MHSLLYSIVLSCQISMGTGFSGASVKDQIELMEKQESMQKKCVQELISCARIGTGGSLDELRVLNCLGKK